MGLKPPPLKAVLFDLDGTLLDTHQDLAAALNQTLTAQGKNPLPVSLIREHVSNGATALVKLGFGEVMDEAERLSIRQELLHHYLMNIAQHTCTFPGIDALLKHLAASSLKWGIVTNKPRIYTDALLQSIKLIPPPAAVVCPDDVGAGKPDPKPLLHACALLAVTPAQTLYVGDHRRDVESAHNAGLVSMAVGYGFIEQGQDFRQWNAQFNVDLAAEIWPIVQTLID